MAVQPLYRCFCGLQQTAILTSRVCGRCGSGLIDQNCGSDPAAQPHTTSRLSAAKLSANPALAAPVKPTGNPLNPFKVTPGIISNGKSSAMTVDVATGFPINDTRQT